MLYNPKVYNNFNAFNDWREALYSGFLIDKELFSLIPMKFLASMPGIKPETRSRLNKKLPVDILI